MRHFHSRYSSDWMMIVNLVLLSWNRENCKSVICVLKFSLFKQKNFQFNIRSLTIYSYQGWCCTFTWKRNNGVQWTLLWICVYIMEPDSRCSFLYIHGEKEFAVNICWTSRRTKQFWTAKFGLLVIQGVSWRSSVRVSKKIIRWKEMFFV